MSQPTKTQAVRNFLHARTHADLAELYTHDMEMQLNVAQDGGTRTDGEFKGRQWQGWTDGVQTWKSFRIPLKASTDPEYNDSVVNFDIDAHAEGIGMTGWDWRLRVSKWVAFDFDAISGHSERHAKKLTEAEMAEVLDRMSSVEWTTIRRSTSGKGLHIYVFLPSVPTANHNEHAALARAILGQLSALTRFDFNAKVDACGGNMWVWHRKMVGTNGLTLIKKGTQLSEVPLNWQDHMTVVTGARRKSLPAFVDAQKSEQSDADQMFDELTGQRSKVSLDVDHVKLIEWFREHQCSAVWNQDHWMLTTHTYHLKEAHEALKLKGIFSTNAVGKDAPNDQNCFMFPGRRGSWTVRRFSHGVAEASTWSQDGSGWTRCYFNKPADLPNAARSFGGVEHPNGGFVFEQAKDAVKAAELLGAEIKLSTWIASRRALLKENKAGKLVIEMDHYADDTMYLTTATNSVEKMLGWLAEKGKWKQVLHTRQVDPTETDIQPLDDVVRHLVTPGNEDSGWALKTEGTWKTEPINHVRSALRALGHAPGDVENVIGSSILKCWTLVNRPFYPEYPAQREWNRNAVQLCYRPTPNREDLHFPTWVKLLDHLGSNLNDAISQHPWAKANGVLTGADYLKCWIASLFQAPEESLPYLFFYGSEDCGKSSFHHAISLLVTHGVVRAEAALTSQYNGEIANAILCIIEEIDLKTNKLAYNKVKDYVTSPQISIRAMYEQSYLIPNMTHWAQFSNHWSSCPLFAGDTRITVISVPDLPSGTKVPRKEFLSLLAKEAADFLAEILSLELPPPVDRLNIPVVVTSEKATAQRNNASLLETFIADNCYHVPGEFMTFGEFADRFREQLEAGDALEWSKIKIGRNLPSKFPKGRISSMQANQGIGNLSWKPKDVDSAEKPVIILKGEFLMNIKGHL